MSYAIYEKRGRIAYVTLNRPEVMNALHLEAHLELAEIWEDFRDDPDVWVAILTGAGERVLGRQRPQGHGRPDGQRRRGPGRGAAAVRAHHTRLRVPEAADRGDQRRGPRRGPGDGPRVRHRRRRRARALRAPRAAGRTLAGAGGVHRLARQIPCKPAMGLLLTGRMFGAEEAWRLGLVNEVVPAADLLPAAECWAAEILECSPLAVQLTKAAALDGLTHSVDDALARDQDRVRRLLASDDFVEGPKAFAERRKPQWTGR